METDKEIVKSLIAGGIIGPALGALLITNSEDGINLGTLAGAAILATYKANALAKQTNLPFIIEEQGSLYEIQSNNSKKFIRKIQKPTVKLQKYFKLK